MKISITLTIFASFILLSGCGGSGANTDRTGIPYAFIEPKEDNKLFASDKGGGDKADQFEEVFTPHPVIPLESALNIKDSKNRQHEEFSDREGVMYDLGVQIGGEETNNPEKSLPAVDPMLESIRQDLMIKWAYTEEDIHSTDKSSGSIEEIEKRISSIENSIKGDMAALRSENLKLLSRLQKLEKQVTVKSNTRKKTPVAKSEKKPERQLSVKAKNSSPPKSFKELYAKALSEYRDRNFRSGIKLFSSLLSIDKNHSLSDNAQYWIGECYYHLADYKRALSEFEKVLKFKDSNKKDSAILMRGKALKHLGQNDSALKQFRSLITRYPRSAYTKRARELIAELEKS